MVSEILILRARPTSMICDITTNSLEVDSHPVFGKHKCYIPTHLRWALQWCKTACMLSCWGILKWRRRNRPRWILKAFNGEFYFLSDLHQIFLMYAWTCVGWIFIFLLQYTFSMWNQKTNWSLEIHGNWKAPFPSKVATEIHVLLNCTCSVACWQYLSLGRCKIVFHY